MQVLKFVRGQFYAPKIKSPKKICQDTQASLQGFVRLCLRMPEHLFCHILLVKARDLSESRFKEKGIRLHLFM